MHVKELLINLIKFLEYSETSAASDSANAKINLEALQYLKDGVTSLESLNKYPHLKRAFLK